MVGNDVGEDMVAEKISMQVFLLKDCPINKGGCDISAFPNGSFEQLIEYVVKLREVSMQDIKQYLDRKYKVKEG